MVVTRTITASTLLGWLLMLAATRICSEAFLISGRQIRQPFLPLPAAQLFERAPRGSDAVSLESYEHDDFRLTYLYKKAAPGREKDRPIVLIHPVGIGLSSWFWKKLFQCYSGNPAIYAPDLIGCGLDHGADPWLPKEKGLFFPLSWAEGVETLLTTVVIPRMQESWGPLLNNSGGGCLVVAQGGLAPVGIVLADRNPLHVQNLMLTSPPTYEDITAGIPESELQRNYNFLTSPIFGGLAFALLENKEIIKFFSDSFLFQETCEDDWLDETGRESRYVEARAPVQSFNAGMLQHRGFERELKEMSQGLIVVSGEADKRGAGRERYGSELENSQLRILRGCNVVPWENPEGVVELIRELGY